MDIQIQKNIQVAMRDGVALATDVYRLAGDDSLPTILMRSPYNKEVPRILLITIDVLRAVQAGYAVVIQDTRGRYLSAGDFDPFFQEIQDGADTIAWVTEQPWSNGRLATVGASYVGATQWLAAMAAPEAVRALAPFLTTDQYYNGWTYKGGAFQLGFVLQWSLGHAQVAALRQPRTSSVSALDLVDALDHIETLYNALPLTAAPYLRELAPAYFDWLAHPTYDAYWKSIAPRTAYAHMTAPALNIGGWFDIFLSGTIANYSGMRAHGGSAAARQSRLIIGPWSHGYFGNVYYEQDFGLLSSTDGADLTAAQLRWFDYWLKDAANGLDELPVKLFIMGINQWRNEADWPLPDTQYRNYYLHSGGAANTANGDGQLSEHAPGDEPADAYTYDPHNPTPTVGGQTLLPGSLIALNAGPRDQRLIDSRHDVLCYTTAPLTRDTEVTGPIELVLYASSSACDTDFTAKLIDVFPDGRALVLTDGILRARYRASFEAPTLLEPDVVYELHLDLVATANVFRSGHRIRIDISSSDFPRFDRNSNSGGVIAEETEQAFITATNRIFHDQAHPSHIVLPIIERT